MRSEEDWFGVTLDLGCSFTRVNDDGSQGRYTVEVGLEFFALLLGGPFLA